MTISLEGVTAVLVTAYREGTEHVDADVVTEIAARTAGAGVPVLTALGNTAEVQQLEVGERHAVLRAVAAGASGATLLAGATGSLRSILHEAETAKQLGYHAIMVHEPSDPFGDASGLVDFYHRLAERSVLPVVLYLRTTRLDAAHIAEATAPSNVVAVKYARKDLHTLTNVMARTAPGACTWINGLAESQVPAFAGVGVHSFTSGIANARPDVALAVHCAVLDGALTGLAQILADYVGPVEAVRAEGGGRYNVSTIKQLLRWQGVEAGGVRPPHSELSQAALEKLDTVRAYGCTAATA
jgi:4-hydroxy-tetrahydrodipicolinate synthase